MALNKAKIANFIKPHFRVFSSFSLPLAKPPYFPVNPYNLPDKLCKLEPDFGSFL